MKRFSLILMCWFSYGSAGAKTIGILGDSISVGSLAHPTIQWDLPTLERNILSGPRVPFLEAYAEDFRSLVEGPDGRVLTPKRLWESTNEFPPPVPWQKSFELGLKANFIGGNIDVEEYGWGFLLGRALEYPPSDILLAGESGNRSGDTKRQALRLLLATQNKIPDAVFVFFTGNDLCSLDLNDDPRRTEEDFAIRIFNGLAELVKAAGGENHGHIYVMSHLDIADLVDSEGILEKKVYAFGGERTCREFRGFNPKTQNASKLVKNEGVITLTRLLGWGDNLPSAKELCRSVFNSEKGSPDYGKHLPQLRIQNRALQDGAAQAVKMTRELVHQMDKDAFLTVTLLESPKTFVAAAEDLANDCFHLSLRGQEKLTRLVRNELRR